VAQQSLYLTWQPHTGGFVILLRHTVGLHWTSDQSVAKTSTYTGQHNTETQRQTHPFLKRGYNRKYHGK
jgi:hypothetical protein